MTTKQRLILKAITFLIIALGLLALAFNVMAFVRPDETFHVVFSILLSSLLIGLPIYVLMEWDAVWAHGCVALFFLAQLVGSLRDLDKFMTAVGTAKLSAFTVVTYTFGILKISFAVLGVILVARLLVGYLSGMKKAARMSTDDLMKDLIESLHVWRRYKNSKSTEELQISRDAVANLKWDEYGLIQRNPRFTELFRAMESQDVQVRERTAREIAGMFKWADYTDLL